MPYNFTSQSQFLSIGLKSYLYFLDFNLISPLSDSTVPNLAVLVAKTQSNISTPNAEHNNISIGVQTPIKYLGLSQGNFLQQ